MASSSASGKMCESTERWCVGDVKKFVAGLNMDGVLKEKLEAAAVTTLIRMDTISAFKSNAFQSKEGEGALYEMVKRLAPPPAEDASHFNPYANFKANHPELSLPVELDFLLQGYETDRIPPGLVFELPLSDNDARRLSVALLEDRIPEWLMRPCSFLTFEENLDIRVQVARLWIEGSKLPIWIGSSITFEDLSKMTVRPQKPVGLPLEDNLPSVFVLDMREKTLDGYYYRNTLKYNVIHPTPDELPDYCTAFRKCYAKVGFPVLVDPFGNLKHDYITGDAETDAENFMDSMETDLIELKFTETPRMYKLLIKLLFNRE